MRLWAGARGQGSSSPLPHCLPAWKPLLTWGLPPSSHPTRGPHTPQGNHVSSPTSHTWMALFPKATEATRPQKLQKGPEGRRVSGRPLRARGQQPGKPWGSPGVPLTDPQTARPAGPQGQTDPSEGWMGSSHGLSCRVLAWLVPGHRGQQGIWELREKSPILRLRGSGRMEKVLGGCSELQARPGPDSPQDDKGRVPLEPPGTVGGGSPSEAPGLWGVPSESPGLWGGSP